MWDECNCAVVWTLVGIAFLWDWNENWPFPVLWPLLSFKIWWHIECSTFTASSFRDCNSSTGLPSPLQALLIVMLPMAHLTSHSKMSGSRWVITPSWLPGSWTSYLYSSSVYSCQLFLISSASVRSVLYPFFLVLIFAWNIPLVSLIFLKRSLLLLLSCFSRVQLCATPYTAAHPAPPSLGFSREEHWSGLPFPSPVHESEKQTIKTRQVTADFQENFIAMEIHNKLHVVRSFSIWSWN